MSNPHQEPGPRSPVPPFELRHRLDRALEHAGVRVSEMAAYLEVSESTMTNYLSGRTRPRAGSLRAWALKCGVPFEWLRDGSVSGPDRASDLPVDGVARSGAKPELAEVWNIQSAPRHLSHTA